MRLAVAGEETGRSVIGDLSRPPRLANTYLPNLEVAKWEVESVSGDYKNLNKNAGATYQRMMNKVFANQIGRNVEVYIDDMIVKTLDQQRHIQDTEQDIRQTRNLPNPANRPNVLLASPLEVHGFHAD
ncbi:hypothetical protein K1719_021690 [Acacia pycnantha]|nr:hypothetical protein K1719_021690 [Acacia pycnantha]